ncbi:MAG: tetratricopeptide repeat protein [Candidatus Zixiibacteriota bacterium]|nr:MAG: tetratricopeptide repeat protein [candidate division Zixibacteria bacterium]
MAKPRIIRLLMVLVIAAFLGSGCVYFNTFFNAKKKFREAEETQKKNREGQQKTGALNQPRGGGAGSRYQTGGRNTGGNQGAQSQSSVTPQVRLLYEDAIKKASKVLKFHPESKYVDDALWLIGKSYFNMNDYIPADRKFQELVINHPNSKFADDSYFYSGLCQIELGNEELAGKAFSRVESLFPESHYIDDIYFAKGKIDKNENNCTAAIDQFNLYIEKFPGGDSAAKALFLIGQCKEEMKDNYDAYLTYSRVKDHNPDRELYFDAALASAVAVLKTDSLHMGMEILDDLAKDERYFDYSSRIRLKIAEGYYLQEEIEKAIEEYNNVTTQSPRTDESAEAYYHLGLIYQNDLFDIAKAKDAFTKAQSESNTSEYKNLALSKSAQIAKLESYQMELQRADSLLMAEQSAGSDSVPAYSAAAPDSIETTLPPDSLPGEPDSIDTAKVTVVEIDTLETMDTTEVVIGPLPEPAVDSPAVFIGPLLPDDSIMVFEDSLYRAEDPGINAVTEDPDSLRVYQDSIKAAEVARRDSIRQSIIKSGIETRFLLAELFAYELNRPDSALTEYLLLVKEHPDSPYAIRALLAAANIEFNRQNATKGNLLLRRIIDEYPRSPQAVQAAEILEYPLDLSRNAVGLYARAESLIYFDNNPDSAIAIFRYIADNFPDLSAKASFAVAWTLENVLNVTDSSAYYEYTAVNNKYPQTEYAEAAKIRLGMASRTGSARQPPREREDETQKEPEEPEADPDSLRRMAMELPRAPRVLAAGEFLYPEELLDKDLKGEVIFKIKLDITGRVQDYEIIGPSGERAIDSVATAALLETEFDTADLDFRQLDSFFIYNIPFERPEIDIFNDPYRDRREQEGH